MDVHFLEPIPKHGETITLLGEIAFFDNDNRKHCIRTALKGQFMKYVGILPEHATVVLIVGARVQEANSQVTLHEIDTTKSFPRPYINLAEVKRVVEVCSGAGFLGVGPRAQWVRCHFAV